jgi:hypothetical protein
MNSRHHAIRAEKAPGGAHLKDSGQRFLKDGLVLVSFSPEVFDGLLVVHKKPIEGVKGFVAGIFNGTRAPALAKWPWSSRDA